MGTCNEKAAFPKNDLEGNCKRRHLHTWQHKPTRKQTHFTFTFQAEENACWMTHFVSLTGSCSEICKIIQCPNEHSCRQMSFDYVLAGIFLPVICSVMLLMERPAENTWDIRGILLSTTASMHGNASAIFISILSVFQYPSPFLTLYGSRWGS